MTHPSLPIYLDYHASTPVDPRVYEAMAPYFMEVFGNPASSSHAFGLKARAAVERARRTVAEGLGAQPQEIVFTSGASESNNLAIKGAVRLCSAKGRHIVTAATEHKAVLNACRALAADGFDVTVLDVEPDGRLSLDTVRSALRDDTVLVSLMHANNEIGVIHDLGAIGRVCRDRGILFHTDATQSIGKLPVDMRELPVDLLSLSGHKIYGPKGVGALYVRKPCRIAPLIDGGGHEGGLRSGTLNVPGIVGLATAVHLATGLAASDASHARRLRDRLWQSLQAAFPRILLNGPPLPEAADERLPNNLNVSLSPPDGEALLEAFAQVAVSTSSACTSAAGEASHVLAALGRPAGLVNLRISVGRQTTDAEIDYAVECIEAARGARGQVLSHTGSGLILHGDGTRNARE